MVISEEKKNMSINILLYIIMFLFGGVMTSMSPMLSEMASEFSLTISQSGLIFTFYNVGFIAFIVIGGLLSEYLSKKKVIMIAMVGFTTALLIVPLSPNFVVLGISLFLIGGFGGILESLCCALLAELNPKRADYHINLSTVFFGVGAFIMPYVASLMISSAQNWKLHYYFLASVSVCISVLFLLNKTTSSIQKSEQIHLGQIKLYFGNLGFLLACLCMSLYVGSEVGAWGWLATLLRKEMNNSIAVASLAVSSFWVWITAGRFICGYFIKRYPIKPILLVLSIAAAIFTFISSIAPNVIIMYISISLMGLAYSSMWPLILSYSSKFSGSSSGTAFALVVGSGSVGSAVIPYIMGVVGEISSLQVALAIPSILFIVICLILGLKRLPRTNTVTDSAIYEPIEILDK